MAISVWHGDLKGNVAAAAEASVTCTGTQGQSRYVLGPQGRNTYNPGRGVYILSGGSTYRWIRDEPLAAGTASTTAFSYDSV